MKYYISDLHLFHENSIAFDHRPFASLQEMHESEEDRFYQKCLSEMKANDCRHVYEAEELRAYNVGCMRDYMNYTPRTLEEILSGVKNDLFK